jgi:hypothetical protein
MKVDGTIIDEKDVTLSISEGDSNVTITNNTITYDKIPVNSILPIDVIATYDGNVAMAYIILDNFIPTNILLPNDPA